MENTDAPGVRGEPGERRASGRGRDSPDAHFFFADVTRKRGVPLCSRTSLLILGKGSLSFPQRELQFHPLVGGGL